MNMPKFRVWCTSSFDSKVKMMIHFDDIQLIDLWQMFFVHRSNYRWDEVNYHNDIFMRSTELYDKNGVEIFEGDIIKGRFYFRGVGAFDSGEGDYEVCDTVVFKNAKFTCKGFDLEDVLCKTVEIVGNVYENPELLGGK